MPEEGITDEELFKRLGVFYNEAQVAEIAKEMDEAGSARARGEFELRPVDEMGQPLSPAEEAAMMNGQTERRKWGQCANLDRISLIPSFPTCSRCFLPRNGAWKPA